MGKTIRYKNGVHIEKLYFIIFGLYDRGNEDGHEEVICIRNFKSFYFYCYNAGGTVCPMSVPIMGIAPEFSTSVQSTYNAAIYLGASNQLTNILTSERCRRGVRAHFLNALV